MPQQARRAVADALLAHLLAASGLAGVIKTHGRGLKHWQDLQATKDNPALFVATGDGDPRGDWGCPPAWHLDFLLYLFTAAPKADGTAQAQLDDLVDAVDAALRPQKIIHRQTLGGQVYDCRITKIETDGAVLGEQAVAWIHVSIRNT